MMFNEHMHHTNHTTTTKTKTKADHERICAEMLAAYDEAIWDDGEFATEATAAAAVTARRRYFQADFFRRVAQNIPA